MPGFLTICESRGTKQGVNHACGDTEVQQLLAFLAHGQTWIVKDCVHGRNINNLTIIPDEHARGRGGTGHRNAHQSTQ